MQTPTAVAVDGVIPLGSLIRRYGCNVALNGNAVNITGAAATVNNVALRVQRI